MYLWKNRGLVYSVILGVLMSYVYFPLLDSIVTDVENSLAGYLIKNYELEARTTIALVMYSLDTLFAIIVSLIVCFPLGRIGQGHVVWKILLFVTAFYFSLIFDYLHDDYLDVLKQFLLVPELSTYVIVSIIAIYFGDRELMHKLKKDEFK